MGKPHPPAKSPPEPRASGRRRNLMLWLLPVAVLALLLAGGGWVAADWWIGLPAGAEAKYVGSKSCIECHRPQYRAWEGSHHDLAMDRATPKSVLGDFSGVEFVHRFPASQDPRRLEIAIGFGASVSIGVDPPPEELFARMFKDGERFMVRTEGPDGKLDDFEVKYVFGVDPLQQYMVEFDRPADLPQEEIARVQVLRVSWDVHNERWFYLPPPDVQEKLAPGDDLHWTGVTQRWNTSCADCHSTNLQKNYDVKTGVYHTTFSEIDVSCESCHGPGSLHVELAEGKSLFWDRERGYALPKLKGDDPQPQIETCAQCHSRRRIVHADFRPGGGYYDHFNSELLRPLTYHPDGQILDEVYVYGSFIQSKMYHKDIRCTDCHDPHTARLKHEGNKVCTSCHQHPSGKYDSPAHHGHKPGSLGAQCVECHMPETTYMEVDPRRDHSLRIPRPDLSVKLGTPNACTGCHLEPDRLPAEQRQSLGEYADWLMAAVSGNEAVRAELERLDRWAADELLKRRGGKEIEERHYGEILAAARRHDAGSKADLESLARDRKQPAIVRATAVAELAAYLAGDDDELDTLKTLLKDPDPQVRAAAVGHFDGLIPTVDEVAIAEADYDVPDEQNSAHVRQIRPAVSALLPLLDDNSRVVRTEAARVLNRVPPRLRGKVMSVPEQEKFHDAFADYTASLMVTSDRAASHTTLGVMHEQRGQARQAIEDYETAMRVEPGFVGPRTNLADLYERLAGVNQQLAGRAAQQGNMEGASGLAEKAIARQQDAARLRSEELELLARDARLAPGVAAVQYRYGLSLYLHDRLEEAERSLLLAAELEPEEPQFALALALLYEKLERWEEALIYASRLSRLRPDDDSYREILHRIESREGP